MGGVRTDSSSRAFSAIGRHAQEPWRRAERRPIGALPAGGELPCVRVRHETAVGRPRRPGSPPQGRARSQRHGTDGWRLGSLPAKGRKQVSARYTLGSHAHRLGVHL